MCDVRFCAKYIITLGTHKIYREELLTKLFSVGYDVENNIMFGTDSLLTEYNPNG